MTDPKKESGKKQDPGKELLTEACKAYGIEEKYILGQTYYPDEKRVCIVTHGGAKVHFRHGAKVEELDPVRVHGIPPEKKSK